MSRASEVGVITARRRRLRLGDRTGQGMAEFAIALPVLLLLALGLIEVSRVLEAGHTIASLTREGANAASRGASLEAAVVVTRENQQASGLGDGGGVIASRLRVEAGVPRVVAQVATPGFEARSKVGLTDSIASPYLGSGLTEGGIYYVMELFVPYQPITAVDRLFRRIVPTELYDRALF